LSPQLRGASLPVADPHAAAPAVTIAEDVLDLARFAPSGDNSQPWRFVLRAADAFDVYGYDTSDHCVYDLDGWASHLAHGMLLETIGIAATRHGRRANIELPADDSLRPLRYRVRLDADPAAREDPLLGAIRTRSVQRLPMSTRPLTTNERDALERAAAPFRVRWFETMRARVALAALCMRNARIRLTIPEAYAVHRAVIDWNATTSEDRLPAASLGAGRALLAMMQHAMVSWQRLDRVNRWTGTLAPRIALDFLPGVRCSAQFALIADAASSRLAHRLAAGRATQRMWLTATAMGLQMQPQYTPLVFARYARADRRFSSVQRAHADARAVADGLAKMLGSDAERAVWLARIGPARPAGGRSLRLPLSTLIAAEAPDALPALIPR
jgi:nitroreductase